MDLTKAFDTINHDSLLTKHKAYGFSKDASTLMCSFLKYRKQRVATNNRAGTTKTVATGVPQGSSIDGPLLFSIFVNDLVLFTQYTILRIYPNDNNILLVEAIRKILRNCAAFGI